MLKLEPSVRNAKWGERMIEVRVRFFTNQIANGKGRVKPKNAWGCGMVRIEKNDVHGIKSKSRVPFNSLLELPAAIEKVLIRNGVKILPSRLMNKYLARRIS